MMMEGNERSLCGGAVLVGLFPVGGGDMLVVAVGESRF